MKQSPHPLRAWLDAQGVKLHAFAVAKKIPWRALYRHVDDDGDIRRPDAMVMDRIASATDGAVPVQAQLDWFKSRGKRNARAKAKAGA